MPNMSSKARSIALQGRLSVLQARGCTQVAFRRCEEQRRLLTIGTRLQANNISRSRAEQTRRLLGKEDRAAGFGMRGIHTGKETEEKGAEGRGAEESGADEKHNNVTDDPSSSIIRRTWRSSPQKEVEAEKLAREERAHQNADPDAPSNKRQPAPAALLAAIARPSALPYAIGTDLCHIPRIHRILSEQLLKTETKTETETETEPETRAPRLWFRVLTPLESSFSGWKHLRTVQRRTEFLAGRWAAKEAVIKAWQTAYPGRKKLFMQDIVILSPKQCKLIALAESTAGGAPAAAEEAPIVAEKEPAVAESAAADADTKDPESSNKTSGPPKAYVRVPGGKPWKEVSVSISHDGDFASAVALVTIDSLSSRHVFMDSTAVRRIVSRTVKLGEGKE